LELTVKYFDNNIENQVWQLCGSIKNK